MNPDRLKGKRYVNLLRCSTVDQADTSIGDQLAVNTAFAKEHGMTWVADVKSEGVSASKTFNRTDLDALLERAGKHEFDLILVHDLSRLTRGGIAHGLDVEQQFNRHGVELVSVSDNLPEGDEKDLLQSVLHYKNRLYAKQLARETTRGLTSSFREGRRPAPSHNPFGLDRLYFTADGNPTTILREVGGGKRELIDAQTKRVLQSFEADAHGHVVRHLKQKYEKSRLILGSPERIAAVRLIFRLYDGEKWGVCNIAKELDARKIPPPRRGNWRGSTIWRIVNNPIYIGFEVGFGIIGGRFFKSGLDRPEATTVDEARMRELGLKTLKVVYRPTDEWCVHHHPELAEILEPDIRPIAEARLRQRMQAGRLPYQALERQPRRDKHSDSPYFLKHILRSRQGDHVMVGRLGGSKKKENRRRYYVVGKAFSDEMYGSPLRRHIPAEPVENAVLAALCEVLSDGDALREIVKKQAAERLSKHSEKEDHEDSLRKERGRLEKQLEMIFETADETARDAVKKLVQSISTRLRTIDSEIERSSMYSEPTASSADVLADAVIENLRALSARIHDMPPLLLHNLIAEFCAKLTVDLETRELQVVFRIPDWAMGAKGKIEEAMGLISSSSSSKRTDTHSSSGVEIATLRCCLMQKEKCYTCRRFRKAA